MTQPSIPEPNLTPLTLDDEHKTWFMRILEDHGFSQISEAIDNDKSDQWFTKTFIGLVQALAVTTSTLERIMGANPPPGSDQGIAVVEQDRRIVLPGDQGFHA